MKKLSQLIGLFVYFADHIKNLSYNLQHLKISTDKLKIKNFNWTKEMEQEFLEIAEKIESKILLSFPNQNLPFVLKADASKFAGGAELFQLVSGKKNLISFHSFSFSGTQISWSIPKKEAYAALKAVKKFLVYIDGQSLDLLLDSKICTQIAKTKDLNGKDMHITSWIVEILMLVPLTKIYPIDREENQTADALSNIGTINVQALTFELDPKVTTLITDPKKIKEILDEAHFSHLGRDYMRTTIKYLFNVEIPHLEKEIMNYLSKCKICLQESTGKTPIFYNVTNPSDLYPNSRWLLDLITMKEDSDGFKYIFHSQDVFTRFSMIAPLKSRETEEIAENLLKFIGFDGIPTKILSDNEFLSKLLIEITEILEIKQVACVPYSHVEKIEIANKNVRVILRKSLDEIKDQKHWSKFIPLVMLKMNNVPAGNTVPPFLLKRNHLAKQDFNHTNIS
jgi:hypothetical protein